MFGWLKKSDGPRRPDAIRCPRDFPRPGQFPKIRETDRDAIRKFLFGRVLGTKKLHSARLPLHGESFVRANVHHSLLHPYGHPNEGEHRYDWFIAIIDADGNMTPGLECQGEPEEDGRVKLGYLREDPHATDPEVLQQIEDAYTKRNQEWMQSPEYAERMRELGVQPDSAAGSDAAAELNPPTRPAVPHAQAPATATGEKNPPGAPATAASPPIPPPPAQVTPPAPPKPES